MALPGGCPGELDEEEEDNAEEGKQGMEEVTCAEERLTWRVFILMKMLLCVGVYLQHGGRQTREADMTDILLYF